MAELLCVKDLTKVYGKRGAVTRALDGVDLSLEAGEYVGIMGASGSGKTTLLNCISTIDRPTSGSIQVDGEELTGLRGRALTRFRRERLGFIFQDCNLLDTLTAFENIALSLSILRTPAAQIRDRVEETAELLGIGDCLDKYPYQMSGGQQQRCAAARAIAADCGCAVLLKGGHSDTDADDLLTFPDGTEIWFPGKRIANPNTHGTGCTLSSAIAANLAKGFALEEAIARAKAYLTDALNAQLDLGRGSGPLDHTLGGVGVENWMHGVPDAVHK